MRNLQKILALVLALVMSLSLMATAGATDFSDDAEIDETFRESVDVLNGLKVFQGSATFPLTTGLPVTSTTAPMPSTSRAAAMGSSIPATRSPVTRPWP